MAGEKAAELPRKTYEKELPDLRTELVKPQERVRATGARLPQTYVPGDAMSL